MLTLRLPADDRRQGLAESPNAFEPSTERFVSDGDGFLDPETMAAQLEIACRYGAVIERVAVRQGFLPSVIAGFCSRRSGWGVGLEPAGAGGTWDDVPRPPVDGRSTPLPPDGLGYSRGLMGLDYDFFDLAKTGGWRDPERNIDAGFAMIADCRNRLRRGSALQGAGLLRASFTAFEHGIERVLRAVRRGEDVDSPTPGWRAGARGCGQDVMFRAGLFQGEGWD